MEDLEKRVKDITQELEVGFSIIIAKDIIDLINALWLEIKMQKETLEGMQEAFCNSEAGNV
jgi:hypothetical protein